MKIPFELEKTQYIKIDDTEVKVSTLPEPIRFEVETLDRILAKRRDTIQELEILELAVQAKRSQLRQLIIDELASKNQ